jgi:hypothetical protein
MDYEVWMLYKVTKLIQILDTMFLETHCYYVWCEVLWVVAYNTMKCDDFHRLQGNKARQQNSAVIMLVLYDMLH